MRRRPDSYWPEIALGVAILIFAALASGFMIAEVLTWRDSIWF